MLILFHEECHKLNFTLNAKKIKKIKNDLTHIHLNQFQTLLWLCIHLDLQISLYFVFTSDSFEMNGIRGNVLDVVAKMFVIEIQ